MRKFSFLLIPLIYTICISIHAQDDESLPKNPIITPENADQVVELMMIGDGGVWNVETGELIHGLQGYDIEQVNTIAYSPDGNSIASGSGSTIFLWDAKTGLLIKQFEGTSPIDTLIFSPNGNWLATGSWSDDMTRVWDTNTGEILQSINISASCLAFSPDSQTLVIGSGDIVQIFNVNKWINWQINVNDVYPGFVTSVAISPDEQSLLIVTVAKFGAENNYIWDLETLTFRHILRGYTEPIYSAVYSPNGLQVAGSATDGKLYIWDAETGLMLYDLQGVDIAIDIVYSSDGRMIIAGHAGGTIGMWDIEAQTMMNILQGHTDSLTTVAVSPDGRFIASGSADGTIRIWGVPINE